MECHYTFKLIVIGDFGVGKSALIDRLTDNFFEDVPHRRYSVQSRTHIVNIEDKTIKLLIWDLPAAELEFRSSILVQYCRAVGAIIVYDTTRRETFDRIPSLLTEARIKGPNMTIILVGNKCDLQIERAVKKEEGEQFAQQNGLLFVEASAATAQNVEEAFMRAIANILQKIQDGIIDVPREFDVMYVEQKSGKAEDARIGKKRYEELLRKAFRLAICGLLFISFFSVFSRGSF